MTNTDELLDEESTRNLLGGSKPISAATLYRGVKAGKYPRPVKLSANVNRWVRSELLTAVDRLIAERDGVAA